MVVRQLLILIYDSSGVHSHGKNCDASAVVSNVEQLIQSSVSLFPESIKITTLLQKKLSFRENGGWGDQRDRKLCVDMSIVK